MQLIIILELLILSLVVICLLNQYYELTDQRKEIKLLNDNIDRLDNIMFHLNERTK